MSWEIRQRLASIVAAEEGGWRFPLGQRRPAAFLYPNTYQVGMSNLGLAILCQLINQRGDYGCERYFLPEGELAALYAKGGTPLLSLDNQLPLGECRVILVMLSFELDYRNLLQMLHLGGLPLEAARRDERQPLVIIGGPCATFNPEPLAEVADAFVIGEGEEVVGRLLDCVSAYEAEPRAEQLAALARLEGVYVPSLYRPQWDGAGNFVGLQPLPGAPSTIRRQWVRQIDAYPCSSALITPATEFSNMYLVEVARGCGRHCRFCMAGYCFRRPRQRQLAALLEAIQRRPAGTRKIGLMGAAVLDYPAIDQLQAYLRQQGLPFALASLRADRLDLATVQALAASGQKTLTVAPEAGSPRLRQAMNKGIEEEHVVQAIRLAAQAGMQHIKCYFMLGLPGEEEEDVEELIAMLGRLRQVMAAAGSRGDLVVSVNPFVPKPFTPYQWQGLCSPAVLRRRFKRLAAACKKDRHIKLLMESLKESLEQAVLARGDRRVGRALLLAFTQGLSLKAALGRLGVDMEEAATAEWPVDAPLPWQHLDMGFSTAYLLAEAEKSRLGRPTPPCFPGCKRCGVCT